MRVAILSLIVLFGILLGAGDSMAAETKKNNERKGIQKNSVAPEANAPLPPSQLTGNLTLSLVRNTYSQTRLADISAVELAARGSLAYALLPHRWTASLGLKMELFSLFSDPSGYSLRNFAVDGRFNFLVEPFVARGVVTLGAGPNFSALTTA